MKRLLSTSDVAALPLSAAAAHDHSSSGVKVTLVYEHPLPDLPHNSIKGVLVEYAPRAKNPAHTHAPSAIIYANVEGAVLNQLNGGPVRTVRKAKALPSYPATGTT